MVNSVDINRVKGIDILMSKKLPIRAFFDDLADAIANPSPSRPLRNAVGVQGRKVCDALSVVPPWARTVPGAVRDLAGICAPYWDSQGISPPTVSVPFTGGQCNAPYNLSYSTFTATITNCPQPEFSVTQVIQGGVFAAFVQGPILSMTPVFDLDNACGPRRLRVRVVTPTSDLTYPITQTGSPDDYLSSAPVSFSVSRVDGPDNCGDPEGVLEPGPTPAPNPPDLPLDEQPIDDPVSGPLLPVPDIPSLPGFPSIPWRNPFASGEPLTGIPGDPGTPGDPVDTTGPGDAAEGEAEPGSELVALKLTLVETPPFSRPLQNDVFRSVAFVYMGTAAGLDQDPAGALVRDGQLVYAEKSGLTKWRVAANVGFRVRVTPFYQEVN